MSEQFTADQKFDWKAYWRACEESDRRMAIERDAERYRFLRQSEAAMSPEQEESFGEVWRSISLKGNEGDRMDATIDKAMDGWPK